MLDFLEAVTKIAAALVATAAAAGVLMHRRSPVRWLYQRVWGEPFASWFRARVVEATQPLDGRLDDVEAGLVHLTKRNDEQHLHNAEQLSAIWVAIADRDPAKRTRHDDPEVTQ